MGPMDQRPVEYRNDVLVYTSPPLDAPSFAAGFVTAQLNAATSATDTDFTVKLCDVEPGGRSINLFEGVIRGRYRESRKAEVPLEPHRVYEFAVDVGVICHLFRAGHRVRVEVSSSNYPAFGPQSQHRRADRQRACLRPPARAPDRVPRWGPPLIHRPAGHPAPLTAERRT